jgi:hypothetical protein
VGAAVGEATTLRAPDEQKTARPPDAEKLRVSKPLRATRLSYRALRVQPLRIKKEKAADHFPCSHRIFQPMEITVF